MKKKKKDKLADKNTEEDPKHIIHFIPVLTALKLLNTKANTSAILSNIKLSNSALAFFVSINLRS